MKSKKLNLLFNLLLAVAGFAFFLCLIYLITSIEYKNREIEDPVAADQRVFEYKLKHKAYNEIISSYYTDRLYDFEPKPGYEDSYRISQYAHAAFMRAVYEAQQNESKIMRNETQLESLKSRLGSYSYTADDIEEVLRKALAK